MHANPERFFFFTEKLFFSTVEKAEFSTIYTKYRWKTLKTPSRTVENSVEKVENT